MWVPAGDGYELSLDGTGLACRDRQGRPCAPIPRQVGATRTYPAWALIQDPDGAQAALAVIPGLDRAASGKPHDAAAVYKELSSRLPVAHQPVFLEHAGRALVAAGDPKRAAVMFARAREVEEAHHLPVDPAIWLAAHREFATAGALSAKSADSFGRRLADLLDPEPALTALVELAVLRTRSGLPPWPALPRQLTSATRRAGRDVGAEQQRLVDRLLPLPAFRESPRPVWSYWRPAIIALANSSPEVRSRLLDLFPVVDGGWWLGVLQDGGALTTFSSDVGAPADWLRRALLQAKKLRGVVPVEFVGLIARLSARLIADGVPVRLHGLGGCGVRMLEVCLQHGVSVVAPAEDSFPGDLHDWLRYRRPNEDLPMLAAHPTFAPLLDQELSDPSDRDRADLERVPALRARLRKVAGTRSAALAELPRHPADDAAVFHALSGLEGRGSAEPGMLYGIQFASRILAGSPDVTGWDNGPDLPGGDTWTSLIGRIGVVALRAVAASTRPERRERLLALLEVWAETIFAEPDGRLRVGVAEAERVLAADATGTAIATGWGERTGERRFVDLRTGDGEPPSLGRVVEVADVPRGWGGADRLRRLVALVRDRGPVPWDTDAVLLLAERTGLSRAGAALVLAGVPGAWRYYTPLLDATERDVLRITTVEVDRAKEELHRVTDEQRLDLLADVLPDEPAELWEPGGLRTVAERVAETWVCLFGRRVRIPEETVSSAGSLATEMSAVDLCASLAEPHTVPLLTTDVDTWLEKAGFEHYRYLRVASADDEADVERLVATLALGVRWAYAALPAGDPVRAGVPATVELLRARLANPGLILTAGSPAFGYRTPGEARAAFGAEPYRGPVPLELETVDDGLAIVVPQGGDVRERLYFRPALLTGDDRCRRLLDVCQYPEALDVVRWLLGEDCDRMLSRIRSGALPEGAFEADPSVTVPDLVAEVSERFDLKPEPAALYLQLLTLLNPTDRHVRRWNGWQPVRHKQAVAALVERGLVVEAKRARAGRGVFLPGGWTEWAKPSLPLETWKADLYGLKLYHGEVTSDGVFWPHRPLPELYATAWQRVRTGDQPG
ncbi:hypothetical protein GCM10022225_68550 [Plantactinospora mayteni]|uniref:DNA-binding protein n=1 Tax=Plantactinospora mayteni TaxID=566021 RepID=A0ABQ4F0X3_9ACTN|nr:hypothetical protein Pma05_71340 [Plantactinospora mayteni]